MNGLEELSSIPTRDFRTVKPSIVIDTGEGDMKEQILLLHRLAQQLRAKRFAYGAFSFERVEVQFDLDDDGKPLGVRFRDMGTANQLIEEFMLLANRRVAEYVGKKLKGKTFVYRIHDKPDPEKISNFRHFITRFGYKLTADENNLPKGNEQADERGCRQERTEHYRNNCAQGNG